MTLTFSRGKLSPVCGLRRRIFLADDRRHRISEFARQGGIKVYYAEAWSETPTGGCWDVISAHKRRETAEAACQRHADAAVYSPNS